MSTQAAAVRAAAGWLAAPHDAAGRPHSVAVRWAAGGGSDGSEETCELASVAQSVALSDASTAAILTTVFSGASFAAHPSTAHPTTARSGASSTALSTAALPDASSTALLTAAHPTTA